METNLISGTLHSLKLQKTLAVNQLKFSIPEPSNANIFRYIMFSRYWTEIIVIGILPLVALIGLNYGIYLKIRKSARFRKLNDGFVVRFGRRLPKGDLINTATPGTATGLNQNTPASTASTASQMRMSSSMVNPGAPVRTPHHSCLEYKSHLYPKYILTIPYLILLVNIIFSRVLREVTGFVSIPKRLYSRFALINAFICVKRESKYKPNPLCVVDIAY